MKRSHKLLFLCMLMITFVSCSTLNKYRWYSLSEKSLLVNEGMTKNEVIQTIGGPDLRSFNNDQEQWEYQQYNTTTISFMILYFENGKVVGMESFTRPKMPQICPPAIHEPVKSDC